MDLFEFDVVLSASGPKRVIVIASSPFYAKRKIAEKYQDEAILKLTDKSDGTGVVEIGPAILI